MSNELIWNSRGDVAVIRGLVVGFTVDRIIGNELGWLWVFTSSQGEKPNMIAFEVASDVGELGQIGRKGEQDNDGSYLTAMLKVYQEIAAVSDVLAVVIKNPTRNKQLRRLDLDTIKLLELAGWTIHCQHRALLFEELEQATLFGGTTRRVKGRMSFFKRLSWQNGQPVAAWEDIIIAERGKGR